MILNDSDLARSCENQIIDSINDRENFKMTCNHVYLNTGIKRLKRKRFG